LGHSILNETQLCGGTLTEIAVRSRQTVHELRTNPTLSYH
jgi:hypothetical protein